MKLQLTKASGNIKEVEIKLDDTFKSLINRTFEETNVKLQLFHFGMAGKNIKYTDNVVQYFVGPGDPEEDLCTYFPSQLCRLCAKTGENMEFIFHEESDMEESINTWLPTYVSKTDLLPKQVCCDCIKKLEMCKAFQIECVQAEVTLKELLNDEKYSIAKSQPDKTPEQPQGPRVFECGFVYGSRGPSHSTREQDKSIQHCCPVCFEGDMVHADEDVSVFAAAANVVAACNSNDTVIGEIKLEPFDASELIEDHDFSIILNSIKAEPEDDYPDEDGSLHLSQDGNMNETRESRGPRTRKQSPIVQDQASIAEDFDETITPSVIKKKITTIFNEDSVSKCSICEESFENMDDLLEHSFELHSSSEFFPCPMCPLAFDAAPQLMVHFEVKHSTSLNKDKDHVDILMHRCEKCEVFFPSEDEKTQHRCVENQPNEEAKNRTTKKPTKSLSCSTCKKHFKSKVLLEFHLQFHLEGAKPLYCHICSEDFSTEESLYKHFRWFHSSQEPKCSICDKSFANFNTLIIHKKLHSNVRNFQCGTCQKSFLDKQTLAEHIVTHMETTPFQCHICNKYLARNSRLKQHMLIHQVQDHRPQEIFDCTVCRQVFPGKTSAIQHGKICHENADSEQATFDIAVIHKVLRCEFCNKNFANIEILNRHRKTHVGVKKFSCEYCNSTFESFARLTSHKLKHLNSKESESDSKEKFSVPLHYVCNECDQSYFLWSYLTIHRRQKHAEVRCLYSCKMCSESFDTSWSRAYHHKAKHGQVQPKNSWWGKAARIHECIYCEKLFASQLLLAKHQVFHHNGAKIKHLDATDVGRVQCDTCGKIFVKQSYLDKHMKVHSEGKSIACPHCNKKFVHESSLSKHMKSHNSRFPYQCSYCEKNFLMKNDLEVHTRRHTGYKPHHCEACDRSFRTKSMLVQHIRIHTNERPYPCDMCDLAFRRSWALKNHKRIHTGQKPFPCSICGKAFRLKQELQTHMSRVHCIEKGQLSNI